MGVCSAKGVMVDVSGVTLELKPDQWERTGSASAFFIPRMLQLKAVDLPGKMLERLELLCMIKNGGEKWGRKQGD